MVVSSVFTAIPPQFSFSIDTLIILAIYPQSETTTERPKSQGMASIVSVVKL